MAKLGFAQTLGQGLPEFGMWQAGGRHSQLQQGTSSNMLSSPCLECGMETVGLGCYLPIMIPGRSSELAHTLPDAPGAGWVPSSLLIAFGYGMTAKPATGMFMVKPPRSSPGLVLFYGPFGSSKVVPSTGSVCS